MIYIDADGVLCDFNKFVIQQTGSPYQGKESWTILEQVDNLFLKLDVLPDAQTSVADLILILGAYQVQILTALPLITGKLYSSQVDKVQWIRNYIDEDIQVNCVQNWSHKKYFVRNKEDVLIDDNRRNCDEWSSAGGIGILHTNWEDTMKQLHYLGVV